MGWRKQMGISELKPPIQKVQNIQKPPEQIPFVPIVPFVDRESKIKKPSTPPLDLSEIKPEGFMSWQERSRLKKIPGLPDDIVQAPAVWTIGDAKDQGEHRDTCPACGEKPWWRKNEPGSKWICGRCHPPANGLDVLSIDE